MLKLRFYLPIQTCDMLGDSMNQGAKVEVPETGYDLRLMYDNNYNSNTIMAKKQLNAECSIKTRNRATMIPNPNWHYISMVPDRTAFDTNTPYWDFRKRKSDVFFINLGENDHSIPEYVRSAYISCVKNIRNKYPDDHIFLLVDPMWSVINQHTAMQLKL